MHISALHGDSEKLSAEAETFISQARKEQIKKEIENLIEDEFYRLEEYASVSIADVAASRAQAFLLHVLKGDEDAAKELFNCHYNTRYISSGYDKGEPWASLIHGNLFETDAIKLRRQLVEAHADLLRNERIADLESIVEGLTKQVRKLEAQLELTYERSHNDY